MAKYGINRVILIGNLGADPEVKTLDSGAKVATLRLATTERVPSKEGQWTDRTEWHRVNVWRGLAETAERYLRKGSTICVEGRITTRSWDGADGKKNYSTEIEATSMVMLDSRGSGESQGASPEQHAYTQSGPGPMNSGGTEADDLPF